MSYTIPDYVDTKEQAVLAVASAIKGEAVTGGDGSVNRALDILADVLAERDVQVPQTNAGAILALAQYVTGGGGGGGSSDFTTAKVTFVSDVASVAYMAATYADEGEGMAFTTPFAEFLEGTTEVEAVLYKGAGVVDCAVLSELTITASGAVEDAGSGQYIITGDCTFTITS